MRKIFLLSLLALVTLTFLIGCGGIVYAPKKGVGYYHRELPEADKAVEDARKAGKDKVCPEEFQAAKDRMEAAYEMYLACHKQEGIEMAKEATAMAKALCPPPAACTLTASPQEIEKGKSTTITFSTSGKVKYAMLDGAGVPVTGTTRTVTPATSITYSGMVTGIGGTKTCSVTVTVACPLPPRPSSKVMVFGEAALFDFGKSDLKPEGKEQIRAYREEARAEMSRADKVKITGHTDNVGDPDYNVKLSLRRAEAVRDYLISLGLDSKKVEVIGAGETEPVADNSTKEGRAKNRRVEVEVIGLGK